MKIILILLIVGSILFNLIKLIVMSREDIKMDLENFHQSLNNLNEFFEGITTTIKNKNQKYF